jgi:hypothetical protein
LPSARGPDGEEEDHASLLTRSPGFESWSGCWKRRAVSSAGQSASMTRWRPQVRLLHRPPKLMIRKGHPTGDGTRLESGRALSLAGSTPAPSAPARAGGFDDPFDGVRGVTAAREPVELEATGSTPAGHPHYDLSDGGDDDSQRARAPHAGPEPELAPVLLRHDRPEVGHVRPDRLPEAADVSDPDVGVTAPPDLAAERDSPTSVRIFWSISSAPSRRRIAKLGSPGGPKGSAAKPSTSRYQAVDRATFATRKAGTADSMLRRAGSAVSRFASREMTHAPSGCLRRTVSA